MVNKPELLAPAGNLKKLQYAFTYGADAVYCGLPDFSLRAKSGFDIKSLKQGINYAKLNKKKIYVTINIFPNCKIIDKISKHLKNLKSNPPDAIIISDPGVFEIVKKTLPKIPIFLSTQANTINYEAVKFWKKQGIKRIILGREATVEDIKKINKKKGTIEIETFVHGAMCTSYSGRCYLSAWLSQRSANQGLCTQPCRWNYNVYLEEPLRPGMLIPVTEDKNGTYILNSKDLCLIDYLKDLVDFGVSSFKIEGRTKSIYYLAVVTKAYRQAIDLLFCKKSKKEKANEFHEIKKEFEKVDNRGYETGFLFGNDSRKLMNFKTSKPENTWEFKGEIIKVENKKIIARIHNVIKNNSTVEIITPQNVYCVKIKNLMDKDGNKIKEARGGNDKTFSFEIAGEKKYQITPNSLIRRKK